MARGGRRNQDDGERVKVSKESWKKALRIFRYMKPYRSTYIVGLFCLLISSLTGTAFPYFLGKLVDPNTVGTNDTTGLLETSNVNDLFIILMVIFGIQAVFGFFRIYLFGIVTENSLRDLRKDAFTKLVTLPSTYFDKHKVGELQSRISSDITQLSETFNTTIAEFLRQVLTILVCVVLIGFISPQLSLIMLSVVPVIAVAAVLFGRYIRKLSKQAQESLADSNGLILDALTGIKNVKTFVNERYEIMRYGGAINKTKDLAIKSSAWRGLFASFILLVMFGSIIFVIWQGMRMVQLGPENGGIRSDEFFQFIFYTVMIGASFGGVSSLFGNLQKAVGATERLMEILGEKSEEIDTTRDTNDLKLSGIVEFSDVHFSYETRADVAVLKGLSFMANNGEQVAIVGPSGSGKSTISSLLLRFYAPTSGVITIDGKDLQSYDLSAIRNQMAIVPQEVQLFSGSVMENIAYGKTNATNDEVIEAARKANAMEFIERFPDGLETIVGDRGIQLSGGQRQRIAIARAVLKDPKILILDEATSSLDSESESLVQEALERLMAGRTTFVIAHRLSTIRKADKILVIDGGELKEEGKHEELMSIENGTYRNLSKLQFEGSSLTKV